MISNVVIPTGTNASGKYYNYMCHMMKYVYLNIFIMSSLTKQPYQHTWNEYIYRKYKIHAYIYVHTITCIYTYSNEK